MTAPPPNVVAVADHAVLVVFDDEINEATLARIRWLDSALARNPPLGIVEVIPALTSVLVDFDPVVTDHANITAAVIANLDGPANTSTGAHHIIDVCYDDEFGPDLSDVAARSGLDSAAVIATHLSGSYAVGMYGFAPGYAYLYGTPPAIQLARNPTPGPLRPVGSVIVAGQQCLILPTPLSTGWCAIGRCAVTMFVDDANHPFLFDVGDTVSFRPIGASELRRRLGEHTHGAR